MTKLIAALGLFLLTPQAGADIGPKPSLTIDWKEVGDLDLSSLKLLQCKDESCKDSHPLQSIGPQRFWCSAERGCGATAYGFSDFMQLEGTAAGKAVKSNSFKTQGMESQYEAKFHEGKLSVSKKK